MLAGIGTNLAKSLPTLVVAGASIGLAIAWLELEPVVPIAIAGAGLVAGAIAFTIGHAAISGSTPRPVASLKWFWWSMLFVASLTAGAGAVLILVGIEWAPQEDWSDREKGLVAAVTAAITTYLETAILKGADEADQGWVGTITKSEFQRVFKDRFPSSSEGEQAVFSETRYGGWGRSARKERARAIERALSTAASAESNAASRHEPGEQ